MTRVSVRSSRSYDLLKLQNVIFQCITDLEMESVIFPGMRVLLKPNLLAASRPEEAVCTHPNFTAAVIDILQRFGAETVVADSPGSGTLQEVARATGLEEICRKRQVELLDLGTYPAVNVDLPSGSLRITRLVREVDLIINLPKLKTHQLTYLTGAVKNLYGCIPGRLKTRYHLKYPTRDALSELLVDIYRFVKPGLTLMDGVVSMDGEGPRAGRPHQTGFVIAGSDGVAVDAVAALLTGLDPLAVPTTRAAHSSGVGRGDLKEIEILGEDTDTLRARNFQHVFEVRKFRTPIQPILARFWRVSLAARPCVDQSRCTGCRTCFHACPPGAISVRDGVCVIDHSICIKCYCCHELCPHQAIVLEKGLLLKILETI